MIWSGGNPVALASSTYCRFTSARLAPAPVRIKEGGGCPLPPSGSKPQSPPKVGRLGRGESSKKEYCFQPVIVRLVPDGSRNLFSPINPSRRQDQSHSPRRRWGLGRGGNPVALASSTYCRFTSARLAPAAVRIKEGGDAPSRRHSRHPSRPRRRRDDWGVGNPVALASSTYCRFTSARLAPAPVRIKEGGDAPSRRQDQRRWGVPPPAVRIKATVPAEGGTTGAGGIQ